jgi:hypothetical membrane protein
VATPVALVGGWWWAGSITPGYDPIRQTISDLAAADAPTHWLMTAALVVTGIAYIVTAVGLRPADGAGRALLGVGGVGVLLTAWIPNDTQGRNQVGHMIVAYLAFLALTVWPAVIARNRPRRAARPAPTLRSGGRDRARSAGAPDVRRDRDRRLDTRAARARPGRRAVGGPLVVVLGCRQRGSAP